MPRTGTKSTKSLLRHGVLLGAVLCASAAASRGASLFGKVIEVNSGDVITISNLNRPVRIRLLAVAAPELDQAFGDVAKKHLADLVYDKSVVVEYAGIASDHSLNGRVLLDGADIGAQMIRDGAAWVDPGTQHRLSATDREVYEQSEEAARSERRGLWQQANPIAPWEFVKATPLRTTSLATANDVARVKRTAPEKPASELTNLTIIASHLAAAPPPSSNSAGFSRVLPPVNGGNWRALRPARESFSVLVPEEGDEQAIPVPAGDRMVDGHVYRGRDGRSAFIVSWITGATYGESDVDAIKNSLAGFLKGFGITFNALSPGQQAFSCELQNGKEVSMGGFVGLEFDLSSCTLPARARVFTRVIDGNRQMYLATAFYAEQDDNVSRFINSFTITPPAKSKLPKK